MRTLACAALLAIGGCAAHDAPVGEIDEGLSVCAKGPVTRGVDVSHWDGAIDWAKVKSGGIEFAIMKVTETTTFVDPTFVANWKGAAGAGVIRGAYHFFRANADAIKQADFFLSTMGPSLPGDLPPTLDLESIDGVAPDVVAQGALDFLAHVLKKTGRTPIVYTSSRFLTSINSPAGFAPYVLWVANWQVTCPKIPNPPWNDWTIWQSSSTTMVPGITVNVDLNQFNGTLADLQTFAGKPPVSMDAGTAPADAGTAPSDDAATTEPPAMTPPTEASGCSMTATQASAPLWLLGLLLALLVRGALRTRGCAESRGTEERRS